MRRVTVTVEHALLQRARRDVKAGRAESVSAWIADAMKRKAQALDELMADVDAMNRAQPPSDEALAAVARSLGKPKRWVADRLRVRERRAG